MNNTHTRPEFNDFNTDIAMPDGVANEVSHASRVHQRRMQEQISKWRMHALRLVLPPKQFDKLVYALRRFGEKTEIDRYFDSTKLHYDVSEPGPRGTILVDPFAKDDGINFNQIHNLTYDGHLLSTLTVTYTENGVNMHETFRSEPIWNKPLKVADQELPKVDEPSRGETIPTPGKFQAGRCTLTSSDFKELTRMQMTHNALMHAAMKKGAPAAGDSNMVRTHPAFLYTRNDYPDGTIELSWEPMLPRSWKEKLWDIFRTWRPWRVLKRPMRSPMRICADCRDLPCSCNPNQ